MYLVITERQRTSVTAGVLERRSCSSVDVFAEAVVFEWLQWNGTTKNDWFFLLWWLIVAGWTVFSARRIWQAMSNKPD